MKKVLLCLLTACCITTVGCVNDETLYSSISETLATEITTIPVTEATEIITETIETEPPVRESSFTETEESFYNKLNVVGDSIALGYSAYGRLPTNHVFAQQSASLSGIKSIPFSSDFGSCYVLDIMAYGQPEYVMLSMGMNEIGNRDPYGFAEKYDNFTKEILEVSPDTTIFIAGITPIVVGHENQYIDNQNISDYNYALSEYFKDNEKVHFINPGVALIDGTGGLCADYSGGDGIHLSGSAYDIMLAEIFEYAAENL